MAAATPEGASFFFGAVAPQLAHRLAAAGTGFFLAAASLRVGATSLFRADVCAPSTASVGAGVFARLGAGDCLRRAARMANTMMAETAETASMTRAVPVGGPSARADARGGRSAYIGAEERRRADAEARGGQEEIGSRRGEAMRQLRRRRAEEKRLRRG